MVEKDYMLVAKAIKGACLDDRSRESVVAELVYRFADRDPRFNAVAFSKACGVKP